jgi:thioesterase domain-containing protein
MGATLADDSYGWQRYVAELAIADVPGDHLSVLRDPDVDVLAATLREHLVASGAVADAGCAPSGALSAGPLAR